VTGSLPPRPLVARSGAMRTWPSTSPCAGPDGMSPVSSIVDTLARRHAAEIEAACEESLTNGLGYGVLCAADGTVSVNSDVPYGEQYWVVGHLAAWVRRNWTG